MHPFIAEQLVAHRQAQALADAHRSRLVRAAAANRPRGARPGRRYRLWVGTTVLVAATIAFARGPAESRPDTSTARLGTEAVTLVGLRATASEMVPYEPGASRTWSPGPQIVGAKVTSGRLTVYGIDGERRVYIAGEGFSAGWAAYRTVNETDELVETLVTNHVRP